MVRMRGLAGFMDDSVVILQSERGQSRTCTWRHQTDKSLSGSGPEAGDRFPLETCLVCLLRSF